MSNDAKITDTVGDTYNVDVVIYHANCPDGFCAAWLLHARWPGATFIAASYGEAAPLAIARGKHVVVADFSYPRAEMILLANVCSSLRVYDHHKTAEAELADLSADPGLRSDANVSIRFAPDRSGAQLVAEWLGVNNWIIDYTADRDLWKWALVDSRNTNAALSSYPMTFTDWDAIALMGYSSLALEGLAINRYRDQVSDNHCVRAGGYAISIPHKIGDSDGVLRIPIVNASSLMSEVAGKLAAEAVGGIGATWFCPTGDGSVRVSLRSTPSGPDVSAIAARMGGGGHAHAAGFEISLTQLEAMLC